MAKKTPKRAPSADEETPQPPGKKVRPRTKSKSKAREALMSRGEDMLQRSLRRATAPDLSALDALLHSFQEGSRPDSLRFRDAEKAEIGKFLAEGLRKGGSQTALYITGMPGLGKTACVMEVTRGLAEAGADFTFVYVNGLKLKTPLEFYSEFVFQLDDCVLRPKMAREYLVTRFKGDAAAQARPIVLVVDEVDFLYTKDQGVFYNIFDWIHGQSANLVIACVANTLDFPDKVLPKINSRMGKNVLIFKPYSADEIHHILRERLGGSRLFSDLALSLVSKKVANFSSDIRKSLDICRKCLYAYKEAEPRPPEIGPNFVNAVLTEEGVKPLCRYVRGCALPLKVFFAALLGELRFSSAKTLDLNALYGRFAIFLAALRLPPVSHGQFRLLVVRCDQMKLVKAYMELAETEKLIVLCKGDDLAFALKDEDALMQDAQIQRVFTCK